MKTFIDNASNAWIITINVDAIKRVRSLLNINLLEVVDGKLLEKLANDPVLLCDIIYAVCKPEADSRHISDEEFGKAMAGDAIAHATTALFEELADFFPSGRRELIRKALIKLKAWEIKLLSAAEAKLESPELEAQLENALKSVGT